MSDGITSYEKRFGQTFDGPLIPFGTVVEYRLISSKDLSRLRQFGPNVFPGFFLGYALHAGGIWKRDIVIADIEELEKMDATEIYSKRLNSNPLLFIRGKRFYSCFRMLCVEQW